MESRPDNIIISDEKNLSSFVMHKDFDGWNKEEKKTHAKNTALRSIRFSDCGYADCAWRRI